MKQLHITAVSPQPIPSFQRNFKMPYMKYGSGVVELIPSGEYFLRTYGLTEGSARRTQEYKEAHKKVTLDLLHAYEAESRAYTAIHRDMAKVRPKNAFEKELVSLSPHKYERKSFTLPRPTKPDVETDLIKEFESINYATPSKTSKDKACFIRERLNANIEKRGQAWQEAADLFYKIESAKEVKENNRFMAAYRSELLQKQDIFEGKEDVVEKGMEELCRTLKVPYNLLLSFQYDKAMSLLKVDTIIEDGLKVPTVKASILASGKISLKNKLVKELISDKANSAISLVYFLTSHFYGISPNINALQLSLFDNTRQNPLLWVEFNRLKFSQLCPKTIDLLSDIITYPHVLKLKTRSDAVELCVMNAISFNKEVDSLLKDEGISDNTKSEGSILELRGL